MEDPSKRGAAAAAAEAAASDLPEPEDAVGGAGESLRRGAAPGLGGSSQADDAARLGEEEEEEKAEEEAPHPPRDEGEEGDGREGVGLHGPPPLGAPKRATPTPPPPPPPADGALSPQARIAPEPGAYWVGPGGAVARGPPPAGDGDGPSSSSGAAAELVDRGDAPTDGGGGSRGSGAAPLPPPLPALAEAEPVVSSVLVHATAVDAEVVPDAEDPGGRGAGGARRRGRAVLGLVAAAAVAAAVAGAAVWAATARRGAAVPAPPETNSTSAPPPTSPPAPASASPSPALGDGYGYGGSCSEREALVDAYLYCLDANNISSCDDCQRPVYQQVLSFLAGAANTSSALCTGDGGPEWYMCTTVFTTCPCLTPCKAEYAAIMDCDVARLGCVVDCGASDGPCPGRDELLAAYYGCLDASGIRACDDCAGGTYPGILQSFVEILNGTGSGPPCADAVPYMCQTLFGACPCLVPCAAETSAIMQCDTESYLECTVECTAFAGGGGGSTSSPSPPTS